MSSTLAPIILFVYNRPWHSEQTLEALMKNELADQSILYIYCDGPKNDASEEDLKNIKEVRALMRLKEWCEKVVLIERTENLGLAESVIKGVSEVIEKHGKVIVLEDDIKTNPLFLTYMNEALNLYEKKRRVYHINGFNNESNLQIVLNDFYFLKFMSCWGWATWKDRWEKLILNYNKIYFELDQNPMKLSKFNYENVLNFHLQLKDNIDGRIKTWAILWYSTVFLFNGLCLTPKYTLVENIGLDGTGENCSISSLHDKIFPSISSINRERLKINILKENFLSRWHLKMFNKFGKVVTIRTFLKSIVN